LRGSPFTLSFVPIMISANKQFSHIPEHIGTNLEGVGLADAARAVSEAIAWLMGSTEMAEPRSGVDPDFSDAAKTIMENAGEY
jgi:hypothetical protein